MGDNMHMEFQEDEEDDDLDFNPLLRGETPSEASSSLSSENEGPFDDIGKHIQSSLDGKLGTPSSKFEKLESYSQDSVNEDEETLMQFDDDSGKSIKHLQFDEGISSINGGEGAGIPTMTFTLDATSNQENNNESIMDDNDDAICRRTRARHSLANYTLEELETFLQESDDDDDLHNVDDEEEYHKFLAAVLLEGDGNGQADQEERSFDEDEENDADFEVELEEALESDVEETISCNPEHSGKQYGEAHVPETRQKKRLKESAKSKKLLVGQPKAALRPILPYTLGSQRPPFSPFAWHMSSPSRFPHCSASISSTDLINGFTACQIGQLYCLMHEHVQLLLQVFSVCVLDPMRQQVANDLRKLISEMIEKHEMTLSCMKVPYPPHCFHSSNLHSSVQFDSNQALNCCWEPVIDNNHVMSILDLAPLRLAKNFMADVKETVSRHRQSFLEDGPSKTFLSKEPLFFAPMSPSLDNMNDDFLGGSMATQSTVSPTSLCQFQAGQQQPKKSLAATLVESTMKQSVALVPADIAKLAQRFLPLFNAALFPHKPPMPAVANRVLFTDAEDGLLAMGIMEHNNDWLAIQQHFLPCKSKHQIFVRQKNRSSSKAPENPIKAVRRMKSSPLTEDEKALIYEGLRIFKHDWMSVWKYFVPHRDPSMLPRQWRIATGTQKSYKKTEAVKEKRRIYEAKRRRLKACLTEQQTLDKEVNFGDNSEGDMDCEDEAYVHEAFLADSEAANSKNMIQNAHPSCISGSNTQAIRLLEYKGSGNGVTRASISSDSGEAQLKAGIENALLNSLKSSKDTHSLQQFSQFRYGASYNISSRHLSSCFISGTSGGHLLTQSYRARKRKGLRIVKLAPDLPPVNLPPSVRVISQSAFKIYHGESRNSNAIDNTLKNNALRVTHVAAETGMSVMNLIEKTCKIQDDHRRNLISDRSNIVHHHMKENFTSESDVQLHPLLFQNPSHFSVTPSKFNFLLESQCSIDTARTAAPDNSREGLGLPAISSTIDFHPLLQRSENTTDGPSISCFDGEASDLRVPHETDVVRLVNGTQSECQCDGSNKSLDLNIHISSMMDGHGIAEVCDHQNAEINASSSKEQPAEKVREILKSFDASDKEIESSRETNQSVQPIVLYSKDGYGFGTTPQSHDISCHHRVEDFHEESNPGIVMEREELSDSEDESENVVFECEDLEDSEEELCSDTPDQIHNKVPIFSSKNDEIQAAQDLHQLQQSSPALHSSVNKRGRHCRGSPSGLQRPKLTRSKNGSSGTKGDGSSPSVFSHPRTRLRKRGHEEDQPALPVSTMGTVAKMAAGSRRSKRRSSELAAVGD